MHKQSDMEPVSRQELASLRQRVTELERLESVCRIAEERLRTINECLLNLGNDAGDNIMRLTALTGELMGATASIYNRLEGDMLVAVGQWQTPADFKRKDRAQGHLCYDVIRKNDERIVHIRNLSSSQYAQTDPNIHAYGLATYVGHVVRWGSEPVGSLCIVFQHDFTPSTDEERLLGIMAASIGSEERRWRNENALQESEERFRCLLQNIPSMAIQGYRRDGTTTYWNQASERLYGYTAQEAIGQHLLDLIIPPEMRGDVKQAIQQMIETGKPIPSAELSLMRKDGSRVAVFSNHVLMNLPGSPLELFCIDIDLTERKQAEETLKASEAKYRFLTEKMNDVIWTMDMNFNMVYVSPSVEKTLGFSPEEHLCRDINEQVTPASMSIVQDVIARELALEQEGQSDPERKIIVEAEYYHKDGSARWLENVINGIRNDQGILTGIYGAARDITERKRLEQELRNSEQRMGLVLEGTDQGLWDVDLLANKINYGANWHKILGYGPEESRFDYEWWINQMHPESRPVFEKALLDYMSGHTKYLDWEYQIRAKSGEWQWVHALGIFTETDKTGFPVKMTSIHRNITVRKQMEEEFLRAHKLESLGVLAGGIAHDFNNLMAIVLGYIDLALIDLPPGHVSRQRLLNAIRSVDQTKDLTSRLITFSRGGGPLMEIFDTVEVIRDAVHRNVKRTKVRATFDFMENLWPVEVDDLQMKQVFYNLTTNAVEAMPEGGHLTVQAENELVTAGEVLDLKEGPYLKITFADEGIGIHEEHLAKIFDPYFTTKKMASQKGLGLGLAVCYSVLKNHDGHITVKSQPGEGASFVLYLPARADMSKDKEVKKVLSTGTIRVLIMDDEPPIREIERAYLERMGYEVTDVKDGQEAIDTYKNALQSGTPFDLVMLDLTVRQGMGGQMAMERLLKIDPSIKAIIASGYVDDPVIEHFSDYGFQGALTKPFKGEEMKSLVEEILH
ncbi:MAG: PAS domain S-box protein [Deltaproteobacteria bacterium]|nr:PAS domain S-box protein [Deltaproteobacteria bacterium]